MSTGRYSNTKLTILTAPILDWKILDKQRFSYGIRYLKCLVQKKPLPKKSKYGGHYAVTRSLIEGLQKIGANFNYNPQSLDDVGDVVVVLSSFDALKQAIQWKRDGKIQRLLAGPNQVSWPSQNRELIAMPEIDIYLVHSEWVQKWFVSEVPELSERCAIWPAGVDTNYWFPSNSNTRQSKKILIYQKIPDMERTKLFFKVILRYQEWMENRGYQVERIVYGNYQHEQYLRNLQSVELAVFFSFNETQGIALAEAWSADVPTLVWNPSLSVGKNIEWIAYSAPYLSNNTGYYFITASEFCSVFEKWESNKECFHPRQWVTDHMSDEVSARLLLSLAFE